MRSLLPLLAASAIVAGCAGSPTGVSDSNARLLGDWATSEVHASSRSDSLVLLTFPPIITFHDGGTYTVRDRFDSTITSALPGSWVFVSNGRQLVMDPGTSRQGVWTIITLNDSALRMKALLNVGGALADVDYSATRD